MMKRRRNNSLTIGILLCLGVSFFVMYMFFTEARQTALDEKDLKPFLSNENISEVMPNKKFSVSEIGKWLKEK